MLSGVSLSGDRFFYPNPLESDGRHERQAWFGCACCPSNVARFVPAIPGYIYAVTDKDLYVNLFVSNNANMRLGNKNIKISQNAGFPWNGKVLLTVEPEKRSKFNIRLRIPGWAVNQAIFGDLYKFTDRNDDTTHISINGKDYPAKITDGYAVISRKWAPGDVISIDFPMPVREVLADERIKEDNDKIAFQRGPLIFCAEWPENGNGNVLNFIIDKKAAVTTEFVPTLLGGTQIIRTSGFQTKKDISGKIDSLGTEPLTLIPYALWNNRGRGQMMVWIPASIKVARPLPAPTIAYRSSIKASKMKRDINAVNDQIEPSGSNDHTVPYYHWWPEKDKWEWIEYDFNKTERISGSKVYWFDDGPSGGCRIPDEYEILYLKGNTWLPVKAKSPYTIKKNKWSNLSFVPVKADAVKIKVRLNKDFSAGVYEWVVD
jgi:hypothetical protein